MIDISFKDFCDRDTLRLNEKHTFTEEIPRGDNSKWWIYPDGKIVMLGNWHYEHILGNLKSLKKYGIKESEIPNPPKETPVRLYALSKGFVRMNYMINGGYLVIEAPSHNWGRMKSVIRDFIIMNANRIDQLSLRVLDSSGRPVKSKDYNWVRAGREQKDLEVEMVTENLKIHLT